MRRIDRSSFGFVVMQLGCISLVGSLSSCGDDPHGPGLPAPPSSTGVRATPAGTSAANGVTAGIKALAAGTQSVTAMASAGTTGSSAAGVLDAGADIDAGDSAGGAGATAAAGSGGASGRAGAAGRAAGGRGGSTAAGSGGAGANPICQNLGCFSVFDCAILHFAEATVCDFTDCVNFVCTP
jgi:hypothetical protein